MRWFVRLNAVIFFLLACQPISSMPFISADEPPVLILSVHPQNRVDFAYHGEQVRFDASASIDPDSFSPLRFEWSVNGTLSSLEPIFTWIPDLSRGTSQTVHIKIIDDAGLYAEELRVYSVSPASRRFYYMKDHLGSVRATIDEFANVVHYSDYYPFGMQMPGRVMENESPSERFTGHELDPETGLIYAGARFYDPELGRWNRPDPLADKYPGWSAYNYTLNNPVNSFDPDGNYVVFINGWYTQYYTALMPARVYWKGFDNEIMKSFPGEGHHYLDGSLGGVFNTLTMRDDEKLYNMDSSNRFSAGFRKGIAEAGYVRSRLKDEAETVKIFSHSMGGAFGIGYAMALAGEGLVVEFHLAIAPYKANDLKTGGVMTFQVGDKGDPVAKWPNIIDAVRIPKKRATARLGLYKFNVNPILRHQISDYDPQDIMNELAKRLYPEDQ